VPLVGFRGMVPCMKMLYILRFNLVLFEGSKLGGAELLVEQRKSIDLYQYNKQGSNIFLVTRVSVYITLSIVF